MDKKDQTPLQRQQDTDGSAVFCHRNMQVHVRFTEGTPDLGTVLKRYFIRLKQE